MSKKQEPVFLNRELSWLDFNQRVLNEAIDKNVPLLERLMFLAITASNLDEFLMVRVGGIKLMLERRSRKKDPAGLTPKQLMTAVSAKIKDMIESQYSCYSKLVSLLSENDIINLAMDELSSEQRDYLDTFFHNEVYPVLTPMAVALDDEFPLLTNLGMNLAVRIASDDPKKQDDFAIIPISAGMKRFISLPTDSGYRYVLIEDLVTAYINNFFPGKEVLEVSPFRLTRNADLAAREDLTPDFMAEMEAVLKMRKTSSCVRMEISDGASPKMQKFLSSGYLTTTSDLYSIPGPLDLKAFMSLATISGFANLKYEHWEPQMSPDVDMANSMFEEISKRNILLCHPFDSYEPVLKFLEEAAADPDVLAIKQTLYRTSSDSRVMAALNKAVDNGKHVTAIVELKARFDEARNIVRAKELEESGAQIIYGIKGLKTHSKILIVVRKEKSGIVRYVHYGTGNYNEKTAKLYTDISLLTRDQDLGRDASTFFNTVTGYSEPQQFLKISSAPFGIRKKLLQLIDEETERAQQGQKGLIMAKMNSLVDPDIIKALYRASQKGVKIKLNIRGICCLKAGVKGLSSNITVVSIIDRYLEHSRIFYFHHGGTEQIYISSADWMPRNLDRRIELMTPVDDARNRKYLKHILDVCLNDTAKGYKMLKTGEYKRTQSGSSKAASSRSQATLYREAQEKSELARQNNHNIFDIYRPKKPAKKKK